MSKQNKDRTAREPRSKTVARILALILAILMVAGSAYYLIYMLVIAVSAVPTAVPRDDINIRVGLKYGSGVPTSFATSTVYGYTVGTQPLSDGLFEYFPFWNLASTAVSVSVDSNLVKSGNTYSATDGTAGVVIGAFHVEFTADFALQDAAVMQQHLDYLNNALIPSGLYAYPSYSNGILRIRAGAFSSRADADAMYPFLAGYMNYFASTVVEPSPSSVVVIDSATDRILFSYDCADGTSLGLAPVQSGTNRCYTKSPASNVYDGIIAYAPHHADDCNGVAVTNVLTLDQYVQGVLPYEIGATWPIETQKAFAIAARSYTASCLNKHAATNGFDLCNNAAHCQAYHGAGRVNDRVVEATESTHGLIITHNGKIATTFYSSSFGGVSVSSGDVWGGTQLPYLVAHATPWERYSEHSGGLWTSEVSPTDLLNYLVNTKGHTQLAGGGYISSIEVLAYAAGSTYVKSLKLTAANGQSATLNTTDGVRLGLGAYLKSANFVVGKGSVQYTVDTVEIVGEHEIDANSDKFVSAPVDASLPSITSDGFISLTEPHSVLTSVGQIQMPLQNASILTAAGPASTDGNSLLVLTAENARAFMLGVLAPPSSSETVIPRIVKDYAIRTETKTAVASSAQNFIFVGKGSGHGTGMSQFGAMDLGELGYDCLQIINAYYTDVEVVYYKELPAFQNR